jgi:hypothetical protein
LGLSLSGSLRLAECFSNGILDPDAAEIVLHEALPK